jgi:hypothetical protein
MNTMNNFNQAANLWVEIRIHTLPDMNQLTGCFVIRWGPGTFSGRGMGGGANIKHKAYHALGCQHHRATLNTLRMKAVCSSEMSQLL